jgi:glycosyltransferase involved in cell wall biosynthesis
MTDLNLLVDALSMHFGGGTTYLVNQLEAIGRVAPSVRMRVLAAPGNAERLAAAVDGPVEVISARGTTRVLWEQTALARRAASPPALLYCPGNSSPLRRGALPVVVALQNPNFFGAPQHLAHNRHWNRRMRRWLTHRSACSADHVVTVSHAMAGAVLADLPSLAGRLTVVPSGTDHLPVADRPPSPLPDRPRLTDGYFLSLANEAPHKRLDLVVRAWDRAVAMMDRPYPLVLAGVIPDTSRERHRRLVDPVRRGSLVHLGPVQDRQEVAWLLRHATALVTMAATESFGFTPLEAASVGCPVVASDIPAHRETIGHRAWLVGADGIEELAHALAAVPDRERPAPWTWPVTWDDHARQLVGVFGEVARVSTADIAR